MVDGKTRCFGSHSELYSKYHDEEWGIPVYDDKMLFEMLILEGAHAGLSWETILNKRDTYRKAFDNFDVQKVANYDEVKFTELIQNIGIVKNKLKIKSATRNAKVFIEIQNEFGTFSKYLWSYVNNTPLKGNWKTLDDMPSSTEISDILSKDLKKRGMNFVGSTIMYAYMQAVGLVNDHFVSCCMYKK
jgi:DNA-3-methyladenine glycosylase I